MKRISILFLKLCLLAVATATTVLLVWFPPQEGRATNLNLLQIYTDPFILYIYLASIAFFTGLYQAFNLLGTIEKGQAFSPEAVRALKIIQLVSVILIGCIGMAMIYIRFFVQGEDPAGSMMLGIIMSGILAMITAAALLFQHLFQRAHELQSENELTV